MEIFTLDLNYFVPEVVASYLIKTGVGPVLIETGPEITYDKLKEGVNISGFSIDDVRHVFLTHIHLDHSGSAWRLAEKGAKIYVHPKGGKHLADPAKLLASASRIYGDKMEKMWGRVRPVPAENIYTTKDGEKIRIANLTIDVAETPGHASHHNVYAIEGNLFTGDVGGMKIGNGPVIPPTPPPDINIEEWLESLKKVKQMNPDVLYPTHFGKSVNVKQHLDEVETRLIEWSDWIGEQLRRGKGEAAITKEFELLVERIIKKPDFPGTSRKAYETADPYWMNVSGLIRYWRKYRLQNQV